AFRDRARRADAGDARGHLHADGFASFVYRSTGSLDQDRFERLVARLPRDIVRAKGIVRFAGRDWQCLFSVTCGRPELTWLKLPGVAETEGVSGGRNRERQEGPPGSRRQAWETAAEGPQERREPHGGAPGGRPEEPARPCRAGTAGPGLHRR